MEPHTGSNTSAGNTYQRSASTNESRPTTDIAGPESPQLSMRVACDRCRLLKLKCCTNGVSESCERCTKARIACVFGRRARAKRRRDSEYASSAEAVSQSEENHTVIATSDKAPPANHSILSPEAGSPRALARLTPLSLFSCPIGPEDALYPLCNGDSLDGEADLELESFAEAPIFDDQQSYDSAIMWDISSRGNVGQTTCCDEEKADCGMHSSISNSYRQTVSGTSAADISASERVHAEEARMSAFTQAGSVQHWTADSIIEPQLNSHVSFDQELLELVSKIQQQLSWLENGPWCKDSTTSLNDYPVGGIIQLANKLTNVAEAIFGRDEGGITGSVFFDHRPSPTSVHSAQGNTPSVLLLVCGYTWLLRLYNVALDHFQNHINHIPIAGEHRMSAESTTACSRAQKPYSTLSSPLCDPELKLGDFPCFSYIMELHRIYAAITTLCDALRSVEYRLGSRGIELRDTAAAALRNWDFRYNKNINSTIKRISRVKLQLRDKIGI